ncbi:Helicase associated protein [Gracilaria domingensis]|nr:Helicase associated protein [Gracilaria domingensis]
MCRLFSADAPLVHLPATPLTAPNSNAPPSTAPVWLPAPPRAMNSCTESRSSTLHTTSTSPTSSLNPTWESRYEELLRWRAEHGDTCVPKAEGALGRWVARQRELKRTGSAQLDQLCVEHGDGNVGGALPQAERVEEAARALRRSDRTGRARHMGVQTAAATQARQAIQGENRRVGQPQVHVEHGRGGLGGQVQAAGGMDARERPRQCAVQRGRARMVGEYAAPMQEKGQAERVARGAVRIAGVCVEPVQLAVEVDQHDGHKQHGVLGGVIGGHDAQLHAGEGGEDDGPVWRQLLANVRGRAAGGYGRGERGRERDDGGVGGGRVVDALAVGGVDSVVAAVRRQRGGGDERGGWAAGAWDGADGRAGVWDGGGDGDGDGDGRGGLGMGGGWAWGWGWGWAT